MITYVTHHLLLRRRQEGGGGGDTDDDGVDSVTSVGCDTDDDVVDVTRTAATVRLTSEEVKTANKRLQSSSSLHTEPPSAHFTMRKLQHKC